MAGKPAFVLFIVMTLAACGGGGGVPETTGPTGGTGSTGEAGSTGETGSTGGTESTGGTGSTGGTESTDGPGTTTAPVGDPPLQPERLFAELSLTDLEIDDSGAPDQILLIRPLQGGETKLLSRNITFVQPRGFVAYVDPSTDIYAVLGQTPSGDGESFSSWRRFGGTGGTFVVWAGAERRRETTVPTSGSARFEGTYMALWSRTRNIQVDAHIIGDVALSADFVQQRIEGIITNRRTTGNGRFNDIILQPTDIVDGRFGGPSGSAVGGELVTADPARSGRYSGLLVGEDAAEAVGNVFMFHPAPPDLDRREDGAFVARDPTAPSLP